MLVEVELVDVEVLVDVELVDVEGLVVCASVVEEVVLGRATDVMVNDVVFVGWAVVCWATVVLTGLVIAGGVGAAVDGALLVLGNCCAVVALALTDAAVEAACGDVGTDTVVVALVVLLGDVLQRPLE